MEQKEKIKNNNFINQTKRLLDKNCNDERLFLRKISISIILITFVSIIFNFIFLFSKNYFIIQPDGRVDKLLQKEYKITYDNLYKFVDTVAINTFNYSYRDIDYLFDRNKDFYTESGLKKLKEAFKDSNLIAYTKEYKLTKSTIPTNEIYNIIGNKNGIFIYRSYSSEEITKNERRIIPTVIYEFNVIKLSKAGGYAYKLKVNSIKEYTKEEYYNKFGITKHN